MQVSVVQFRPWAPSYHPHSHSPQSILAGFRRLRHSQGPLFYVASHSRSFTSSLPAAACISLARRPLVCYHVYKQAQSMESMASTTFTVRVEPRVKKRLEKLAKSTGRTRSFLAAEALNDYLDLNEWQG